MTTNRCSFYSLFPAMLLALIVPTLARAIPPSEVMSADGVAITLKGDSSNRYRYQFSAGGYNYHFFWDSGPIYLRIHSILGYDDEGNVIDYTYAQRYGDGVPVATVTLLSFGGAGKARYATTNFFRVPVSFYDNENIKHIAVDFSVVDGRMTVGPWLPMSGGWEDLSSVREHQLLLIR